MRLSRVRAWVLVVVETPLISDRRCFPCDGILPTPTP